MPIVDINIIALILAALLNVAVGFVWYAKQLFGASWQKFVGLSDKDIKDGGTTPMLIVPLLAVIEAFVLSHFIQYTIAFYPEYSLASIALLTSFWVWFGFSFPALGAAYLFAQRRKKLLLIDAGFKFVSILGMSLIITSFL